MASLLAATAAASPSPSPAPDLARVQPQAGIIDGSNPTKYNPKDPIILFIIQAGLIIIICHILHWPLAKIRQPRVIAEVVGGIILGPSVMGRIPGFRDAIFPKDSLPNLSVVANLGLILYLFLIGLETDVRVLLVNWRVATSVAFAGLALPFAVGCALAWGVYNAFRTDQGLEPIRFSVYMLFIGIAVAITAFPVLCRILTELKLLDTSVGVITLSAGVVNDVVGWILLALCVALVNAGTGLSALWILLSCLGFLLALLYIAKPALVYILRRSRSFDKGPSQGIISLILLLALASAFFTGIIGVHPIFGAFMVGLIIPRQERFNIRVTEKLEDLIGSLFLPLYFTLSGLNTNLGLLNTALVWGYVFATTLVALLTKIIGASLAARLNGLRWRESMTIGVLMSCKGLVELIVLNIGLQASILSTRTFTIFVVMALLTTFATTPFVSLLYPPWYQKKTEAWKRGRLDLGSPTPSRQSETSNSSGRKQVLERIDRLLVYLSLETMPTLFNFLFLFSNSPFENETPSSCSRPIAPADENNDSGGSTGEHRQRQGHKPTSTRPTGRLWAHGVRLLELTDRDSSVMTVSQIDEYSRQDPIVNTFRAVGHLHDISASGEVAVVPRAMFADALVTKATKMTSDLLVLPWSRAADAANLHVLPPMAGSVEGASASHAALVKSLLTFYQHDVGIFISRPLHERTASEAPGDQSVPGCSQPASPLGGAPPVVMSTLRRCHILFPYFGDGADDGLALRLVLQLCQRSTVRATIVAFSTSAPDAVLSIPDLGELPARVAGRISLESSPGCATAEDLLAHVAPSSPTSAEEAHLIILGRRRHGPRIEGGKLHHNVAEDLEDCLGPVAAHLVAAGVQADLFVVQARRAGEAT